MTRREANDNVPVVPGVPTPSVETPAPKVLGRETVSLPKRFYIDVTTAAVADGFAVHLDGRAIKTPKKLLLAVPTRRLADQIAAEWAAQGQQIDPTSMPVTRLANTTLDAVIPNLAAVRADIVDYSGSDALCYRAGEPEALSLRQAEVWDPILAWAQQVLGARFITQTGVVHTDQPTATLDAVRSAVARLSPWQLAPVHVITTLTGSAILALGVAHQGLGLDAAWAAAHVDEDWQISTWGHDDEAQIRRARRWLEMQAASSMLATLY